MPRYEFVVLLMMTSFILVKSLRIAMMYQGVNVKGLEAYQRLTHVRDALEAESVLCIREKKL